MYFLPLRIIISTHSSVFLCSFSSECCFLLTYVYWLNTASFLCFCWSWSLPVCQVSHLCCHSFIIIIITPSLFQSPDRLSSADTHINLISLQLFLNLSTVHSNSWEMSTVTVSRTELDRRRPGRWGLLLSELLCNSLQFNYWCCSVCRLLNVLIYGFPRHFSCVDYQHVLRSIRKWLGAFFLFHIWMDIDHIQLRCFQNVNFQQCGWTHL